MQAPKQIPVIEGQSALLQSIPLDQLFRGEIRLLLEEIPVETLGKSSSSLTDHDINVYRSLLPGPLHPVRIRDYVQSGDGFTSVDLVFHLHESGLKALPIFKKCVVKPGGSHEAAISQGNRLQFINELGIDTPEIFTISKATIFQQYLLGAVDASTLHSSSVDVSTTLPQLIFIAQQLDAAGFRTTNFIRDIMIHDSRCVYVDGGFDLGEPNASRSSRNALNTLLQRFPNHSEVIQDLYDSRNIA